MKQLGNLAVVCAQRPDVLMQIEGNLVRIYVGKVLIHAAITTTWDDDEKIQSIIHELNFGRYSKIACTACEDRKCAFRSKSGEALRLNCPLWKEEEV